LLRIHDKNTYLVNNYAIILKIQFKEKIMNRRTALKVATFTALGATDVSNKLLKSSSV